MGVFPRSLFSALLACASVAGCVQPLAGIHGTVVGVEEGDRLVLLANDIPLFVRLIGVDAPDKGQPSWKGAKDFTARLALGQDVQVRHYAVDAEGTIRGHIYLSDGRCLNEAILEAGFGWWVEQEQSETLFGLLEESARLEKKGLWEASHPIAPWEWRQTKTSVAR